VAEHAGREGPLLPILHDVQHELGCVDAESEAQIARRSTSAAPTSTAWSASTTISTPGRPAPRSADLPRRGVQGARGRGADPGGRAGAGERVKLTTVYCLGLCSAGPSARVGDRLHARLDAAGLAQVIENAR
jgi:formate dehydrogenase subunit gamma